MIKKKLQISRSDSVQLFWHTGALVKILPIDGVKICFFIRTARLEFYFAFEPRV
jgi:hypothetical protein